MKISARETNFELCIDPIYGNKEKAMKALHCSTIKIEDNNFSWISIQDGVFLWIFFEKDTFNKAHFLI